MKTDLHHCYVLHSRPYRETSLLLDILSSQFGCLRLVAKGVKRPRNYKSVLLQPGIRLMLAWSQRGSLGTLTEVEDTGKRFSLHGNKVISCFYMNELLIRMLHADEPHQEIFEIYQQALNDLEKGIDEQKILRIFEKNLLQELGYGLVLDHETATGEQIDSEKEYFYVMDRGPCLENLQTNQSIKISGRALTALRLNQEWNGEIARETKLLLRMVLKSHAGDKPFGSRELYRAYLQNVKGS